MTTTTTFDVHAAIPLHVTIGDKYRPAMEITEQADADAYWKRMVEHNMACAAAEGKHQTREEAERIERGNVGYFAGYYGLETQERVERLFMAVHPVFGSVKGPQMTAEEILHAGMNMAKERNG